MKNKNFAWIHIPGIVLVISVIAFLALLLTYTASNKTAAASQSYDFALASDFSFTPGAFTFPGTGVSLRGATSLSTDWSTIFAGEDPANFGDIIFRSKKDSDGDVISVGIIDNTDESGDWYIVKYDGSTGAKIWEEEISSNTDSFEYEEPSNFVIDSNDDIIVTGSAFFGGDEDFYTVKFDGEGDGFGGGTILWDHTEDGSAASSLDAGFGIAVDSSDDVFVTGYIETSGSGNNWRTLKLDGSTGSVDWTSDYNTLDDKAFDLTLDSDENVIVIGKGPSTGYRVIKYGNAAGTAMWQRTVDVGAGGTPDGLHVIVDSNDDVIAAGENIANGGDWMLAKIDGSTGSIEWEGTVDPSSGGDDEVYQIAVDSDNDVYVGGISDNGGDDDLVIYKYDGDGDGASGLSLDWAITLEYATSYYDGYWNDFDTPKMELFGFNTSGEIVAAYGADFPGGDGWHYVVLDPTDGSEKTDLEVSFAGGIFSPVYGVTVDQTTETLLVGGGFDNVSGYTDGRTSHISLNADGAYPTTAPTVQNREPYYHAEALTTFAETVTGGSTGSVEYQISPNGTDFYYWSGAAWAIESGSGYPTQTSTATEINTNLGTFPSTDPGAFYFRAFFISDGGQSIGLDSLDITTGDTGTATWTFDVENNYDLPAEIEVTGGVAKLGGGGGLAAAWDTDAATDHSLAEDVVADSSGNVYTVGKDSATDAMNLVRLTSSGTVAQTFSPFSIDTFTPYALAIDSSDNLYVAGYFEDSGDLFIKKAFVYKYDVSGGTIPAIPEWTTTVADPGLAKDFEFTDIDVDPTDSFLIAGGVCLQGFDKHACFTKLSTATGAIDGTWVTSNPADADSPAGLSTFHPSTCSAAFRDVKNVRVDIDENGDFYYTAQCEGGFVF